MKAIATINIPILIEDISLKLSQKIRLKILDRIDITIITINVLNFNLERKVLVIMILKNTREKKLPIETKLKIRILAILIKAPFSAPDFTLKVSGKITNPQILNKGQKVPLLRVENILDLKENTWFKDNKETILCFNLNKGKSELLSK